MEGLSLPGREPSAFSSLFSENRQDLFSVLALFPMPAELFSPDGISLFVNQAFVDAFHIDAEKLVGRLNILKDPYINGILGLTEELRRVFAGEALSFHDLKVPFEEIGNRYHSGKVRQMPNDLYQEIICFPLRDADESVSGVVALFMTKQVCQARLDAIRIREYIELHWLDDFDPDSIARTVGMSRDHMARIFKRFIGMTPYSYYQELKIERIKDALGNARLSIREAFASCGADYSGSLAELFKHRLGMTPTQYRQTLRSPGSADARTEPGGSCTREEPSLCAPRLTSEKIGLLYQVLECFPLPIKVFTPDGTVAFANHVILEMWNISEPSQIVGKYNLIRDPVTNERLGLHDYVLRTFRGEVVLVPEVKVPLEAFSVWYKARTLSYDIESMYTDILNFPVRNENGQLTHIVSVFLTTRIYQGQADIARAREYLENHWKEPFDIDRLAQVVGLSPSHLSRLFKKHTGTAPYSYYQALKIGQLKAALRDRNLSIAEAFEACGFEYPGNCARFFKEKVGMTPTQYRKSVLK
ncbi:MAG: helix-turn-helix domain-containing protein [Bacillota bacterium]